MKLIMKRKGEFRCYFRDSDGRCGTGTGLQPTYSYECQIETADLLDKNGFIIDQLDVDKYFQTKYGVSSKNPIGHKAKSCELIARDAVIDVKSMVENHMFGVHGMSLVYRIAVTISFGEAASLTAEWTP